MLWNEDAFQHQWYDLPVRVYAFSLFTFLCKVLSEVMLSCNSSMILVAPFRPQKEAFTDLQALLVEEPLKLPMLWNLLVQSYVRKFHWGGGVIVPTHLEIIKRPIHKPGFLRKL